MGLVTSICVSFDILMFRLDVLKIPNIKEFDFVFEKRYKTTFNQFSKEEA
jgi:hypothetical protein